MVSVTSEVERLAAALDRTFVIETEHDQLVHVVQTCPLCDAQLGVWIGTGVTDAALHRSLFTVYDEHCCVAAIDAFTQFERAERALVVAAERIGLVDDPILRARAEREADLMAARADELRAKLR